MGVGLLRLKERIWLLGLVMMEVLLVIGLHTLGRLGGFTIDWSNLSGWLEDTAFEEAAGALILIAALILAYWLLVSTVSYALAARVGNPTTIRTVGWLTLPPVRRLVRRAVALSIAASSVVGPLAPAIAKLAGAAGAPGVVVVVDTDDSVLTARTEPLDAEDEPGVILPPHLMAKAEPAEAKPETPPIESTGPLDGSISHRVTVQRGDHLWSLSERHLERILTADGLSEHEIARYWVRVIEANRQTIRSGDPDLIYPGEMIVLPAVVP